MRAISAAANVAACDKAGIEPLIAIGPFSRIIRRWASASKRGWAAPQDPTPVEAMAHRLTTPAGRALYALRKADAPEPVFGIIKSALGIPSIFFAARPSRARARRMEPRHHGLEHQADIRLRPRLMKP